MNHKKEQEAVQNATGWRPWITWTAGVGCWLVLALTIHLSHPAASRSIWLLVLVPTGCLFYDAIVCQTRNPISGLVLSLVLSWFLIGCQQNVSYGRFSFALSFLLFAGLCIFYLMRPHVVQPIGRELLWVVLLVAGTITVPLVVSSTLVAKQYGCDWSIVVNLATVLIEVGVATIIWWEMLQRGLARAIVLVLVAVKCLLEG